MTLFGVEYIISIPFLEYMTNTQPTNQEIMDLLVDVSNIVKRVEAKTIDNHTSIEELGAAINEHSVHMDKRFDDIETNLSNLESYTKKEFASVKSHMWSLEANMESFQHEI